VTLGSHQRAVGISQVHLTPRWILDALGPFDCDPAAASPRPWDCASVNFSETDDGLSRVWRGRCWLNPPYDRRGVKRWIQRLAEHGHGTALLHARCETDWFAMCWQHASGILFMRTRIKFCRPDGSEQPHNSGAPPVLVAFGEEDLARLRESGIEGQLVTAWEDVNRSRPVTDKILLRKPATSEPEKSLINEEASMAKNNPAESIKLSDEKSASAEARRALPLSVGNPVSAAALAINQSHLEEFATQGVQSSVVLCERPRKGIFFTVRKEKTKQWGDRGFFFLLQLEGHDPYLVSPEIAKLKADEDVIRPVLLVRYVTMAGEEALWPLKLDRTDARSNPYNKSAMNIREEAEKGWVRIMSAEGHYRHQASTRTFEQVPPKFSERSFDELLNAAFKDRIITSLDHEIWDVLANGSTR
jgi:hypothetical protein